MEELRAILNEGKQLGAKRFYMAADFINVQIGHRGRRICSTGLTAAARMGITRER